MKSLTKTARTKTQKELEKEAGGSIQRYDLPEIYLAKPDEPRFLKLLPLQEIDPENTISSCQYARLTRVHVFYAEKRRTVALCPGRQCEQDPTLPCAMSARADLEKDQYEENSPDYLALDKKAGNLRQERHHIYAVVDLTGMVQTDDASAMADWPTCFGDLPNRETDDEECKVCPAKGICGRSVSLLDLKFSKHKQNPGFNFMGAWNQGPEVVSSIFEVGIDEDGDFCMDEIPTRVVKFWKEGVKRATTYFGQIKPLTKEIMIPRHVMEQIAEDFGEHTMLEVYDKAIECDLDTLRQLAAAVTIPTGDPGDFDPQQIEKAAQERRDQAKAATKAPKKGKSKPKGKQKAKAESKPKAKEEVPEESSPHEQMLKAPGIDDPDSIRWNTKVDPPVPECRGRYSEDFSKCSSVDDAGNDKDPDLVCPVRDDCASETMMASMAGSGEPEEPEQTALEEYAELAIANYNGRRMKCFADPKVRRDGDKGACIMCHKQFNDIFELCGQAIQEAT